MRPKRPLYKRLLNSGKGKQGPNNLGGQHRIGKRGTLEEDSSLGLKGINILHVNLGRLVSGKSYTIPYTLFRNKY